MDAVIAPHGKDPAAIGAVLVGQAANHDEHVNIGSRVEPADGQGRKGRL